MCEELSRAEIRSNYLMYKSSLQQEALKSNYYLQGFGEVIDELLEERESKLRPEKEHKAYLEGKRDALISMEKLDKQYALEEIKEIFEELREIKAGTYKPKSRKRLKR